MSYTQVQFIGDVASRFEAPFEDAVDYWNGAITGAPVSPVGFSSAFNVNSLCGVDFTFPANSQFDGLIIFAEVGPIDGRGSVLGRAGPCGFTGNFPRLGIMEFDSADADDLISDNLFDEVVKHEMAHVIGIGTLWSGLGLIQGEGGSNPRYLGGNGNAGFAQLGGSGNIPIENTGGAGTAGGHWRETTFQNELMTGFLNGGVVNPNSIMTIRSLADMGYSVNLNAAESYSIPKEEIHSGVSVDLNGDYIDFGYTDLNVAVEESNAQFVANKKFNENVTIGLVMLAVVAAFTVLAAVGARKMRKTALETEESRL